MRAFKVVTYSPTEGYRSWNNKWVLDYRIGQWTEAYKGTGVLVFRSREDARSFIRGGYGDEEIAILEVECHGPVDLPKLPVCTTIASERDVILHWLGSPVQRYQNLTYTWPNGTMAFKRIKPIRRVQ